MLLQIRNRSLRLSLFAVMAIFGLVFAPTISRALAQDVPAWSEVCTVEGKQALKWELASGDASAQRASAFHLEHCPLCGLGSHAAPASQNQPQALCSGRHDAVPALFLHAPRPLFAWRRAQPRAPPLLS